MVRKILPLIFFLLSNSAMSLDRVLRINVESTIRNKIDQGLILTSEHHFSAKILPGESITEKLNEKISIEFLLEEVSLRDSTFSVDGKILYRGISLKNEFILPKMNFSLEQRHSVRLDLNNKKTVDLSFYLKKENFDEF